MKIIRSKRKTIALIIDPEGNLTVRAPLGVSQSLVDRFVHEKSAWIQHNQNLAKQRKRASHQFLAGEKFFYLGKPYPLFFRLQQEEPLIKKDAFYSSRK